MADKAERKKYNYMELVIQHILKTKISLAQEETKTINAILRPVYEQLITKLKAKSSLFKSIYEQIFHGGSYYDGLKVGKPEEFDLDLLMKLTSTCVLKPIPEHPGFVTLEVKEAASEIRELMQDDYLSPQCVLKWMESITTKCLEEFQQSGNQRIITVDDKEYLIKICKSGPAFTLKLTAKSGDITFDVDLVPCFKFGPDHWPQPGFKCSPNKNKTDFFIVPKIQKNLAETPIGKRAWRLSFQEQEREMMNGFGTLKPSIKLIKRLRDKMEQKAISSYFIKTVFLWEITTRPKEFWANSQSYVFMEMLEVYANRLISGEIPYFWNKSNNLIASIPKVTLENYGNRVTRFIADIKKKQEPTFIATYYLTAEELSAMETEIPSCKKKLDCEILQVTSDSNSSIKANIGNVTISSITENEYSALKNMLLKTQKELTAVNNELKNVKEENHSMCELIKKMNDKLDNLTGVVLDLSDQCKLINKKTDNDLGLQLLGDPLAANFRNPRLN